MTPAAVASACSKTVRQQLAIALARCARTCDEVAPALGAEANLALVAAREAHPEPALPEDDDHDALAAAIRNAHQREAAIYFALAQVGGDDAEARLRMAAEDHGREVGARLRGRSRGDVTPSSALDIVASASLETLPCRPSAALLGETAAHVTYKHDACPYQQAWSAAGASHALMCQIISAWTRGVVGGVGGPGQSLEYRRPRAIALGDERCEHEISGRSR